MGCREKLDEKGRFIVNIKRLKDTLLQGTTTVTFVREELG